MKNDSNRCVRYVRATTFVVAITAVWLLTSVMWPNSYAASNTIGAALCGAGLYYTLRAAIELFRA